VSAYKQKYQTREWIKLVVLFHLEEIDQTLLGLVRAMCWEANAS